MGGAKLKYSHIRNNCGNSGSDGHWGNTKLFHRGCCHGDKEVHVNYLSPMVKAMNRTFDEKPKRKQQGTGDLGRIATAFNTAKREEAQLGKSFCSTLHEASSCVELTDPADNQSTENESFLEGM